jgi:DNA-binding LacI/PurR family transcriptional regulator
LSDPPTAVICINDLTAIGALQAASSMGLQVGRELAIAGFDGIEITENIQATLTTIKQPVYDIARDLVKLLLAEINGVPLLQRRIQMQPELILRASTG